MAPTDPDRQLRVVASQRARELGQRYDDLVPVAALGQGFRYENERVSFGSFQKGIHRPRQMRGAAALTLLTAARVPGRPAPYEDELDLENRAIVYHYRAGPIDQPDNRALREVRLRLHQQRFRQNVLRAYRHRCTVCALREPALVQAAHIVEDADEGGIAAVVNGLALCAIHHLAYDRNLMGIDPEGVVHIARRLRDERDGPMLREGLQGFHGGRIVVPRRLENRPDPVRLEQRFDRFVEISGAA